MKKQLEDLKEQLSILKEKIEKVESVIDDSNKEVVIIDKSQFLSLTHINENGSDYFRFNECTYKVPDNVIKLFKEGKINAMVISKLDKPVRPYWQYTKLTLTHKLLNDVEAAIHIHYR